MASLRIAVLGCGRIGRMHAELIARAVPGLALATVYDVDAAAAAAVGAELGVSVATSVDDALGRADAVAICTSTDTHSELIAGAASAGLATFCEKPISLDIAAVDAALAAVERAGTLLHVGFNRRFDPAHRAVHQAVIDGAAGEVHVVKITSRDPAPPPVGYLARSGGLFRDMAIHDFDMARFVTGSEVVEVHAAGAVRVDPAIGDADDVDTAVTTLRHVDGCLTVIDNSRRAVYGYDQRVEVFGSAGMIASRNPPMNATARYDAAGGHTPPIAAFFLDRYAESYRWQWVAFAAAVAAGGPPPVSGADGRAALAIADAAERSRRSNRPVAVAEVAAGTG
jgi:myo-inositol 2-dehydrogenase / D-chiro-inositol 1-dehydrogenase